jgi:hypothetical protein
MPQSLNRLPNQELQFIGKAVSKLHPSLLVELEPIIKRPPPILDHFILLPALLARFCELKDIPEPSIKGIWKGHEVSNQKTMFIAVALVLYDPQLLTGIHSDIMRQKLAEELAGMLQVNRTWISQRANDVKTYLNPFKALPAHNDFKNEVYKIAKVFEIEFGK